MKKRIREGDVDKLKDRVTGREGEREGLKRNDVCATSIRCGDGLTRTGKSEKQE